MFLLPATGVTEDHQGVREAIQVVVPEVQGQGLLWLSWNETPD